MKQVTILLTCFLFTAFQGQAQQKKFTAPMYMSKVSTAYAPVYQQHDQLSKLVDSQAAAASFDIWKTDMEEHMKSAKKAIKKEEGFQGDDSYVEALQNEIEYMSSKEYEKNYYDILAIVQSDEWQQNKTTANAKYQEIKNLFDVRNAKMNVFLTQRNQVIQTFKTKYKSDYDNEFCDRFENVKIEIRSTELGMAELQQNVWGTVSKMPFAFYNLYTVYRQYSQDGKATNRYVIVFNKLDDGSTKATDLYTNIGKLLTNCGATKQEDMNFFIDSTNKGNGYNWNNQELRLEQYSPSDANGKTYHQTALTFTVN